MANSSAGPDIDYHERVLLVLGLVAVALCAGALVWLALRRPGVEPYPVYGWCGLAGLAACELLLALHVAWVAEFFTALAWSAYIAIVDAAVYRLRGRSLLTRRAEAFVAMAALSVPGWLVFEAYNLRLRNWVYTGVPGRFWVFALGAVWAFATIYPGIFETAELIHAGWAEKLHWRRWQPRAAWPLVLLGAILLLAPLAAPAAWAPYLFGLAWVGFIFLLDPLNRALGWPSLLDDLARGCPGRGAALLGAGAACGFFWEFWNYWAQGKWQYVFPILHRYRVFEMPVVGFLGFPPFALECFTVYVFLAHALLPRRWRAELFPPVW